ncbi:zf-DHHC-domain-containing protein [Peniophora sp. CONT]|nr:zf-DHHC-domain-containing protein [Peniophora sp. CONT]
MHLKPELVRPRWDPHPPENLPHPLNRTPKTTGDGGRLVRNYELHPSKNKYAFRGRLLIGGDKPYAFIFTLTILLGLGGTWFATTCRWWWTNLSPALAGVGIYIFLLCISLFAVTSFSDPGILPRELDLDPPYPAETPGSEGRQPYPREVKVRAGNIRVKWCTTCKTYRPPRSSHCRLCDNCVDGCDHHCQWVNNCVGRRNYTTFFALITSGTLTLIMVIVSSAIHLYLLAQRNSWSFAHALRTGAGSAVCFSLAIILIFPVSALLFYHVRLLLLNITTIEQIRVTAHKRLVPNAAAPPNPFSHGGWRRNLAAVLCRPPGMSWIDLPGVATEDRRAINPAYAGAEDGWVGGRE